MLVTSCLLIRDKCIVNSYSWRNLILFDWARSLWTVWNALFMPGKWVYLNLSHKVTGII